MKLKDFYKILLILYILLVFIDSVFVGAISIFINLNYLLLFLVVVYIISELNEKVFSK